MGPSLLLTLPELVLTVGGIILMLWAAWGGDRASGGVTIGAIVALSIAIVAVILPPVGYGVAFDGLFAVDGFSSYAKVLIYGATIVALIASRAYFVRSGESRAEFPVLLTFSAVGMGMMVSALDLITLYVGLELQSLAAYVLASFLRRDQRSAEAGLKYFVLGALASGILLYGSSLLYGFAGTTSFAGIADAFVGEKSIGLTFGLVFALAGLAFKASAVPFHMWTPDVYEGAPTPVTTFFASAPKVAAIGLLVRLTAEAMGPALTDWRPIIIFMALASILLGAVAAIGQTNIKRLLAYSSINNIGFALIGLAVGTEDGIAAVMTYMAVYIVMTLGSFLCVLRMRDADGRPVETIASLSGLARTRPMLALALMMFMFSLAGIPPLFGFWPKFLVFDAATRAGLFWLAAAGAVGSVVGAYYYLKIVKTMYFDEPVAPFAAPDSRAESGLIAVAATLISPLGYLAIPLLGAASLTAARALF